MSYRPSYYASDEWAEYDDTLQASAERHGVHLTDQDPADGLWQGETEPAGAYLVRADTFDQITAWAGELAGRYNQDSVMVGRFSPDGDARVYQFQIPDHRAAGVLEALAEAGVPGGRTYNGNLEIADVDGSTVPPDALRVLTAAFGEGTVARAHVFFVGPDQKYKAHSPIKEIQAVRQIYAEQHRLPARTPLPHLTAADDIAAAIAYDRAPHRPEDPRVARSYRAFRRHVAAQWDALVDAGYTFEPWRDDGQPYADSAAMLADLRDNRHLYYFRTEVSQDTEGALLPGHPMAGPVTVTHQGRRVRRVCNDVFRAVHDAIAHSEGHQFGPYGEKRAWWTHRSCLPREARLALWCETRGQNCWTNSGPHMTTVERDGTVRTLRHGEPGWLPLSERPFASSKCVSVHASLL